MSKQDVLNEVWGIPQKTKGNCYVFALAPETRKGGYHKKRLHKARPGDKCERFQNESFDFQNCTDIVKRILCDNPTNVKKVERKSKNMQLNDNYHLMAAYLSPGYGKGEGTDFHFLRRMPLTSVANSWSKFKHNTPMKCVDQLLTTQPKYCWVHQRGWSKGGPLLHDASGNLILDPEMADMNYRSVNYKIFCGLFLVKTRSATVTSRYDM